MRRKVVVVVVAVAMIVIVAALLLTAERRPVVFRFWPDAGDVRPRYYCLMNPFRDRAPERLAEQGLERLRDGRVAEVAASADTETRPDFIEMETKWPVLDWRIADRTDSPAATTLAYWVTRGNGYPGEEEIRFVIRGNRITEISASY